MRVKSLVITFCFIALLASCSKKIKKQAEESQFSPVKEYIKTAQVKLGQDLIEAKLTDIPLPFGLDPIEHFAHINDESNQVIIGYHAQMNNFQGLKVFYQKEMERLGWQELSCFEGAELLLMFDRPGKLCTVSIRPESNEKVKLVLFVGQQEIS